VITLYASDNCLGASSNFPASTTSPACTQLFSSTLAIPIYTTLDICSDACGTHTPVPVPSPIPAPQPKPQPQPKPSPVPVPVPVPVPLGTPKPLPSPKPAPLPLPSPVPLPVPIPVPVPVPAPVLPPSNGSSSSSNSTSSSEDAILDNLAASVAIVGSIFVLGWFLFFILLAISRRSTDTALELAVPVYENGKYVAEKRSAVTLQQMEHYRVLLAEEGMRQLKKTVQNLRHRGQQ
jgi:hypothetical protein